MEQGGSFYLAVMPRHRLKLTTLIWPVKTSKTENCTSFAGQLENNDLRNTLDIFPQSPPAPFTHRIEREGNVLL